MTTYISLLRGINVSGQKLIKMAELKQLYESLGFDAVQTYIQSGNVVFKSDESDRSKLISRIEKTIRQKYGFDVPVQIRNKDEMKSIIDDLPLKGECELNRLFVVFLAEKPPLVPFDEIEKLKTPQDEIVFMDGHIYMYLPAGAGKSKLDNNTLERKLKVRATGRNWRTVNKLYEMCRE
jgi:uncharacterized protein (DUF1697 family)